MSGDLSSAGIEPRYNRHTPRSNIINDFYVPLLKNAVRYDRKTGFFSSTILAAASQGFSEFCNQENSKIRLITGVRLYPKDVETIENPTNSELLEIISRILTEKMDESLSAPDFEKERLAGLAWMLNEGKLEIKIGIMLDEETGKILSSGTAYYHGKEGLVYDDKGNSAHFIGGINESEAAWDRSGDVIHVHRSWTGDFGKYELETHITPAAQEFEDEWNIDGFSRDKRLAIVSMPQAVKEKWIDYHQPRNPGDIGEPRSDKDGGKEKNKHNFFSKKWKHQDDAVEKFVDEGNGILEMATGTGKTYTAMKIIKRLIEKKKIDRVIVATERVPLLDQWAGEFYSMISANFFDTDITIEKHYGQNSREMDYFIDSTGTKPRFLLIGNYYLPRLVQGRPGSFFKRTIFISDEVHNLGAKTKVETLDGQISKFEYRLGLSATPERIFDHTGSEFITNEIGEVIFRFDLKNAIEKGILCEFDYEPLFYALSSSDKKKIANAGWQRDKVLKEAKTKKEKDLIEKIYRRKVSNVRKLSKEKLPLFKEFVKLSPRILDRCLIFVQQKNYGELVQQIIFDILEGNYHTYYDEDDDSVFNQFKDGKLKALITCIKISEGVDVKDLKNIIIFSSDRAKLTTVQRIGRCLRTTDTDPHKRAFVLDFIVEKDLLKPESADAERYNWLSAISKTKREND